ncbi:MAG: L-threonylcarbamoyladenylate synthase [Alphaproteobacteria bacterium]
MPVLRRDAMTRLLPINDDSLSLAAKTLAAGGLVSFPTETVYGLGADARDAQAVAGIFAAKNRPQFNPLISHVATTEAAFALGTPTPSARALAAAFWPGPMTLVLHRTKDCPIAMLTSAGLDKVAIRVPAHPDAKRLLQLFNAPVAAPSANPSGKISPTRSEHVMQSLEGRIDLVLDGGPCESGVESTIIDCTGPTVQLLRPGGITTGQISAALEAAGLSAVISTPSGSSRPASPGQLASHYAPDATLRLAALKADGDEELIGFGPVAGQGKLGLSLSTIGDVNEAAANLFDMLHRADAAGCNRIAVAPIPEQGLGEAINDRLRRAAAPRDVL